MTPIKFIITLTDAGYGFDLIGGEGMDPADMALKVFEANYYVLMHPEEFTAHLKLSEVDTLRFARALRAQVRRDKEKKAKGDVELPPVDGTN